jgi:uncharacterized protein YcgI (DUF1989 family)
VPVVVPDVEELRMRIVRELAVPPCSGLAVELAAGQVLRITDTAGGQPGDLVAFRRDRLAAKLSQARTRVENGRVAITIGHRLWTNQFPPEALLEIVEDTAGPHDLLFTPCCRYALVKRFGVDRDGCLEHLAQALAPWQIAPHEVPDPLNLFFRVAVDDAGAMRVSPPASAPGSVIALRAEVPCLVAIATCAVPFAGRAPSGYQLQVAEP